MYATLDHADPLAPEPGRSPDLAPRAQTRLAGALPRDAVGMATGWSHPAQAAAQGARYGEDQRPNLVAILGATAIVGGFTPVVSTWLIQALDNKAAPGLWMAFAGACGLIATLLIYRRREGATAALPGTVRPMAGE